VLKEKEIQFALWIATGFIIPVAIIILAKYFFAPGTTGIKIAGLASVFVFLGSLYFAFKKCPDTISC